MNLSLSVLGHLIKGKQDATTQTDTHSGMMILCRARCGFGFLFGSRLNVKCNFDIFKIFFSRSRFSLSTVHNDFLVYKI